MPRHKLVIDFSPEIGGMFCKYCRVFKPMEAFSTCEIKTWRSAECTSCRSQRGKAMTPEQREERNRKQRELRLRLIKEREGNYEEVVQVCCFCGFDGLSRHFVQDKMKKSGHNNVCLACGNERSRKWKQANREKHRQNNRDYYQRNKPKVAAYARKWRRASPRNRIITAVRGAMRRAMARGTKSGKSVELLGMPFDEYKTWLEDRFELGMSWDNYGNGLGKWNIDHIKPLFTFDLTKPAQQRKAFHYSNTRPMWQTENASNGNYAWCKSQGKAGYLSA